MDREILELLKSMQSDIKKMDSKIDKNTILLEDLTIKVKTVAEVQKSYMEQNDKAHNEIIKPLAEKTNLIELAVKETSQDIKELKEKFDKVEKVTMQNTYDVAYLKSVK
jgi:hypothetical protein